MELGGELGEEPGGGGKLGSKCVRHGSLTRLHPHAVTACNYALTLCHRGAEVVEWLLLQCYAQYCHLNYYLSYQCTVLRITGGEMRVLLQWTWMPKMILDTCTMVT